MSAIDRIVAPELAETLAHGFVVSARIVGPFVVTRVRFPSVRLYRLDVEFDNGWKLSGFCDARGENVRTDMAQHPCGRSIVLMPDHERPALAALKEGLRVARANERKAE